MPKFWKDYSVIEEMLMANIRADNVEEVKRLVETNRKFAYLS